MSRFKTKIQVVLVAVVLMLAAGAPAQAERAYEVTRPAVRRVEVEPTARASFQSVLWHWVKRRLTRYAMAAN